jgi:D-alanyl-lipoteichoic acid acyltransferase DltB (MBOAT superfamily)
LTGSYFFYGWWNPYYLLLVAYSTGLDFLLVMFMDHCPLPGHSPPKAADPTLKIAFRVSAALTLALLANAFLGPATLRPTSLAFAILVLLMAVGAFFRSRPIWLLISLVNNLALLLFFKYAGFVIENLNYVLDYSPLSFRFSDPSTLMPYGFEYVLPVGISFFTFQSMSYTIDFYLGKVARERNFLRFATFVCFFPQLMAGPIERAKHLLPQFQQAPPFRLQNLTDGMSLFLVGLFKKLALADYLAIYVDRVYGDPGGCDAPDLILATFAFAWQIFFDFSGYTDMARGVARMMGFHLILNFNNPYLATGLGDFWSRWHISLSTWFRDYVYIPLGGNRHGTLATYRNLFITFLVSGIWHGANWTFAIWGILHALGVMLTRELERSAFYRHRVPVLFKQAGVFAYVTFAWIFFRAASLSDALLIVKRIAGAAWSNPGIPALMLLLVGVVWLYQFTYESRLRPVLSSGSVRVTLAVGMMLYLCLCSSSGGAFIYFQF